MTPSQNLCTAVLGKNLQNPIDENGPDPEIAALREKVHSALAAVRDKRNSFTIQDLKRLLFRCASPLTAVTKVLPTAYSCPRLTSMAVSLYINVLYDCLAFRGLYVICHPRQHRHRDMDVGDFGATNV